MTPEQCSVCHDNYDEAGRRPRSLPCGHTFCSACITNTVEDDNLTCPSCRAQHSVTSTTLFPINFCVQEFVSTLKRSRLTSGNKKKFLSMAEEQESSIRSLITDCDEVLSQLGEYWGQLGDWKTRHHQLHQRMVDLTTAACELMEQEDTSVVKYTTQGEAILFCLNTNTGNTDQVDMTSNIAQVDMTSNIAQVDMTSNMTRVDMTSNMTRVDMISNMAQVDMTSNMAQVDMTSNMAQVDMASNMSQVDMTSNIAQVDMTSNMTRVDMISNMAQVDMTSNMAQVDMTSNMTQVDMTSNIAQVDMTSNMTRVDMTSNMTRVDMTSNMAQVDMTSNMAQVDMTSNMTQVDMTSNMAQVDTTSNMAQVDMTSNMTRVDMTSNMTRVDMTSNMTRVDMTSNMTRVDMTSNMAQVDMTSNMAQVDMTSNMAQVNMTSNMSQVDMTSNIAQVDMTSNMTRVDMISNMAQVDMTSNMAQVDMTSNMTQVDMTSNIAQVDMTSNMTRVDMTSNMTRVDMTSNMAQVDMTSNMTQVDMTSNMAQVNMTSNMAQVDMTSNMAQVNMTSNMAQVNMTSNMAQVNMTSNMAQVDMTSNMAQVNMTSNMAQVDMTSNMAEDWLQECQQLFPDYNTVYTSIKVQETIRKTTRETGVTTLLLHLADSTSTITEKVSTITGGFYLEQLTLVDLHMMSEPVKRLVEDGLVVAVQQDEDGCRSARITLQDGQLYLHPLLRQPTPALAHTLQESEVVGLLDPSCTLAFLDLGWAGSTRGRVTIRLTPDTPLARQFVLLCTGQRGHSYLNSKLLGVVDIGFPGECVEGGDYECNNGQGGAALLADLRGQYRVSDKAGTVLCGGEGERTSVQGAQFVITTRDQSDGDQWIHVFGEVASGLDVVLAAASHSPITEVTVVDCGVVLPL